MIPTIDRTAAVIAWIVGQLQPIHKPHAQIMKQLDVATAAWCGACLRRSS